MTRLIATGKESSRKVIAGVLKVVDIVSTTMGAKGRHVFIQSEAGGVSATKDGANTARMVDLPDPLENIGARLAIEAALNTADQAGDGTTSTTVILGSILKNVLPHLENDDINPVTLADDLRHNAELAKDAIVKFSKKVEKGSSELLNIAKISANGDESVAEMVVAAVDQVGADGVVTITDSPSGNTVLETVSGIRLDTGFVSPYFINNAQKRVCEFVRPMIAITNIDFTNVKQVMGMGSMASQMGRPLVIFGNSFEGEALATLIHNSVQGNVKVCCVRAPGVGRNQQELMEDIAMITSGVFISEQKGHDIKNFHEDHFGSCEKITISSDRCIIGGGDGDQETVENHLSDLELSMSSETNPVFRDIIQKRISTIRSGIAMIYVGAATDTELKERKDRIEDSVRATQSALQGGYLPGGGSAYVIGANAILGDTVAAILMRKALQAPFHTITTNAGLKSEPVNGWLGVDVNTGEVVNMEKHGIIDPTLVVMTAIDNAVRIASIIIKSGGSVYVSKGKIEPIR